MRGNACVANVFVTQCGRIRIARVAWIQSRVMTEEKKQQILTNRVMETATASVEYVNVILCKEKKKWVAWTAHSVFVIH